MVLGLSVGAMAAAALSFAVLLGHGFSARDKPWAVEAFVARRLRWLAIPAAARELTNPVPLTSETLASGRSHFADHCASCHANDGSGGTEVGRNLYPPAPDMREPWTQSLTDGALFYIIRNGIRFTGMPAWGPEDPEVDEGSWHLVHFIRHLPEITKAEVITMEAMNPKTREEIENEREKEQFLRGDDMPPVRQHH